MLMGLGVSDRIERRLPPLPRYAYAIHQADHRFVVRHQQFISPQGKWKVSAANLERDLYRVRRECGSGGKGQTDFPSFVRREAAANPPALLPGEHKLVIFFGPQICGS